MENEIRQSILRTVLYSDIFDYPLTSEQIWKFLLTPKKVKRDNFEKILEDIRLPVVEKRGWYFLNGREKILKKRINRKRESEKKIKISGNTAKMLSIIPSVLLIGVSGGVSLYNADKKDDIDFFVVTKENSLWSTRLLAILLLKIMGKHRSRKDKKVADKICLNMLISEDNLEFSKDRKDLYTAHEIVQMIPIFNRNKTFEKFMSKNLWVKEYMPNSFDEVRDKRISAKGGSASGRKDKKQPAVINYLLLTIEFLVKEIQLWYIRRHTEKEIILGGILAFHPIDYKSEIMEAFEKKLKKYGQKI